MNKKVRIARPVRFFAFVLIVTLTILFGVFSIIGSRSVAATADTYVQVEVEEGDTLWTIAEEFGDGSKDTRVVVDEICEVNDIQAGDIVAGDLLFIPIE